MTRPFLLFFLALAIHGVSAATLDEKLGEQWKRFDAARALLKMHPVSREEWEKELRISVPFTESDRDALRERQDALIDEARRTAIGQSTLSLDKLRAGDPTRVREFCTELPKGGMLHVHAWGTVSEDALADMLRKINPPVRSLEIARMLSPKSGHATGNFNAGDARLYPKEVAFLKSLARRYGESPRYQTLKPIDRQQLRALFFLKSGSHPFSRFEAIFTLLVKLVLDKPPFDPEPLMYDDFFNRARELNLDYVEIQAPIELTAKGMGNIDRWSQDIRQRFGITARMQDSFFRASPVEKLAEAAAQLLKLSPATSLVGINMVNNEEGNPALEKGQPVFVPFLKAAEEGRTRLHRALHAGELGDVRNVRDSLLLGAERIGHGTHLAEDPVTLEYARLHHVPIEVNLTSNLILRSAPSLEDHPFLRFLRLGLPVSLSTDDEGIFGTTIADECVKAIRHTDLTYAELRQMMLNSIETAFVPDNERNNLAARLKKKLAEFEKKWKDRQS